MVAIRTTLLESLQNQSRWLSLMAVIQSKATPHQSGFFRSLDASAFRQAVDQGYIGVCKTKGGLEDAAYAFSHATVLGDPAQAFLSRLSTISQLTQQAPQFLGAKDPWSSHLKANLATACVSQSLAMDLIPNRHWPF